MKFCVQCGQQLMPEARFCVSCGTAVQEGATSSASPASSPAAPAATAATADRAELRQPEFAAAGAGHGGFSPAAGYAAGPETTAGAAPGVAGAAAPSAAAPAAAPVRTSAFAGVPVSDYVRDGIAALALIMSLFMVWTYGGQNSTAATRVDVILITLVSLLSLGISYLWRAGVFGPGMGYRRIQDLKLLANAPYLLLVLVYVALHLITADSFGSGAVGPLGAAVAFGLAGALLAAQPRRGDIAPGQVDQPRNQRWISVTLGVSGLAAVAALVQIVRHWVAYGDSGLIGWSILSTFLALASPAILVFISLQVHKRSDGWRSVGMALGLGAGFLSLLALIDDLTLLQLSLVAEGPNFSLLFWMAFGAAVSAPSVARLTEASAAAPTARRDALLPFLYLAGGLSALLAVGAVIALIAKATNDFSQGSIIPQVIAVLFGLLLTAGAIVTLRLSAKDQRSVYLLPSGYAGLSFVLGLVLTIVWAVKDETTLGPVIMLLAFVVPAAILAVLWLPSASRAHFHSLPSSGSGTSGFTFAGASAASAASAAPAVPAVPAVPMAPAAPAAVGPEILAAAADPATPLARLQQLAADHPQARPAIAANPSTYPGLLAWLGQLGDPAVDAALRQRG